MTMHDNICPNCGTFCEDVLAIELPWDDPRADTEGGRVAYWKWPCCGAMYDDLTGEQVDWHIVDGADKEAQDARLR